MTVQDRHRRFGPIVVSAAANKEWPRIATRVQATLGRRELRAGHQRFTTAEILDVLSLGDKDIIEGATTRAGGKLNAVALGRWLKDRLVDARLGGLVLRSAQDRQKRACFWIEKE
jgi:hypothetical protein